MREAFFDCMIAVGRVLLSPRHYWGDVGAVRPQSASAKRIETLLVEADSLP